ncbi:MAG: hypothetical protein U0U25_09785 [Flavobacteriales bacterium]
MRSSLRNVLLILLLTGAGGVHAQAVEPIPLSDRYQHTVPPPHKDAATEHFEPPLAAPAEPARVPGPRVRIRLQPVRISMKDLLDQITLEDIFDALSRL